MGGYGDLRDVRQDLKTKRPVLDGSRIATGFETSGRFDRAMSCVRSVCAAIDRWPLWFQQMRIHSAPQLSRLRHRRHPCRLRRPGEPQRAGHSAPAREAIATEDLLTRADERLGTAELPPGEMKDHLEVIVGASTRQSRAGPARPVPEFYSQFRGARRFVPPSCPITHRYGLAVRT